MSFADAFFDGTATLGGIDAQRVDEPDLEHWLTNPPTPSTPHRQAAVLVTAAPMGRLLDVFRPDVLVDARMRKRITPESQRGLAPLVIGLGPNFAAAENCDIAIETQWGDHLGDVVEEGHTRGLAGEPRSFDGHARDRFVYAPTAGRFDTAATLGERVESGQRLAAIGPRDLAAPMSGIVRGLTHDAVWVEQGTKVIEVDPRMDPATAFGIGERPRRISDGTAAAIDRHQPRPLPMSPTREHTDR